MLHHQLSALEFDLDVLLFMYLAAPQYCFTQSCNRP